MRRDMDKVIVERPRVGHKRPSKKTGMRLGAHQISDDFDAGPMRLPSSRKRQYGGWDSKELNDLLSPLKRFLHTQVGQPWDRVYRDIVAATDARTVTGKHLLDHVEQFVITDTSCERPGPVKGEEFYVHPRTGLLCFRSFRDRK